MHLGRDGSNAESQNINHKGYHTSQYRCRGMKAIHAVPEISYDHTLPTEGIAGGRGEGQFYNTRRFKEIYKSFIRVSKFNFH